MEGINMAKKKDFSKPIQVDTATMAFPANVRHLMPAYEDIPEDFKNGDGPYNKWQQKWFFLD